MKRLWLLLMVVVLLVVVTSQGFAQRVYVVKKGETLFEIAAREYQNGWLWPEIYRANPGIKDPNLIFPGQELVIPDIPRKKVVTVLELSQKIDSVRNATQKIESDVKNLVVSLRERRAEYYFDMGSLRREIGQLERRVKRIELRKKRSQISHVSEKSEKLRMRVWVDGAWCLTQHPAGYGAREIAAGVEIGRFGAYSGTPAVSGMAVVWLTLPGLRWGVIEIAPHLNAGFSSINLNVGRDLARTQAFITNARPFGALGAKVTINWRLSGCYIIWYGVANDIKATQFWDPYNSNAGQAGLEIDLGSGRSLVAETYVAKGYLPEWWVLAMVPISRQYRIGLGYGMQNPYTENHLRGMAVFRAEYSW